MRAYEFGHAIGIHAADILTIEINQFCKNAVNVCLDLFTSRFSKLKNGFGFTFNYKH